MVQKAQENRCTLALRNPHSGEKLSTSHPFGPRLRLVRPYDAPADAAGSGRELFDLYRAARAAQRKAEIAGQSDLAQAARGIAATTMSRLRGLRSLYR